MMHPDTEGIEEEKVKLWLEDRHGIVRAMEVLPVERILNRLRRMRVDRVVWMTYYAMLDRMLRYGREAQGEARIDLTNGQIVISDWILPKSPSPFDGTSRLYKLHKHFFIFYIVPPYTNLDIPLNRLFSSEELELLNEKYEGDIYKMIEGEGIPYDEREVNVLIDNFEKERKDWDWWDKIKGLEHIYIDRRVVPEPKARTTMIAKLKEMIK
jgi:hypothetical protein